MDQCSDCVPMSLPLVSLASLEEETKESKTTFISGDPHQLNPITLTGIVQLTWHYHIGSL
jgi:hypothetical protein